MLATWRKGTNFNSHLGPRIWVDDIIDNGNDRVGVRDVNVVPFTRDFTVRVYFARIRPKQLSIITPRDPIYSRGFSN